MTTTSDEPEAKGVSLLERATQKIGGGATAAPRTIVRPPFDVVDPEKAAGARNSNKQSRRGDIDLMSLRDNGFIVPHAPSTRVAEEFRLVKRALLLKAFARGEDMIKNGNLMLVCSAQPNEGKTYCSVNLALSIASERDLTVLLVDADFAKPEVLSTLGLEGGKGLVDVIADPSIDLADCMIKTNIENLTVLPAGRQHHLTTELLASERMGAIVEEIAQRYRDRVIIFDSPPVLASSAASVLALHCGQTLFVVEADNTTEANLNEGLALISGCKHIQLLLNKSNFSTAGKSFGSYYGYGV